MYLTVSLSSSSFFTAFQIFHKHQQQIILQYAIPVQLDSIQWYNNMAITEKTSPNLPSCLYDNNHCTDGGYTAQNKSQSPILLMHKGSPSLPF